MRDIKFRFWFGNVMRPDIERPIPEEYAILTRNGVLGYSSESPIIMQFTGLKDKNGKEIYEGDIIKSTGGDCLKISWIDDGYWSWFELLKDNPSSVIGNIYENPELLKD